MTWNKFFSLYGDPFLEIILFVFISILSIWAIYHLLSKALLFFKIKTKKELLSENEALKKENERLLDEINRSNTEKATSGIAILGPLKIKCDTISYIVSQPFEQPSNNNSRIKIVHYVNSEKTDSVYATFEYILGQLPDYFMLVNKNQIVNLKEVYNVQGNELYLKKLKSSFIISDAKKEEFEQRWSQLALFDNAN